MSALTRHKELIAVTAISACFLALTLYNIGYNNTPLTTYTTIGGDTFSIDLGTSRQVYSVMVLVKNGESTLKIQSGSPVNLVTIKSKTVQGYYQWEIIPLGIETDYIRIEAESSGAEIAEIILTDESGQKLPIAAIRAEEGMLPGLEHLVDEQDKMALPINAMSEAIFDEVYFVRAAEDYLNSRTPSEITHPPLGKEIIALGIAVLGYSPFGWRALEALFATFMIPALYVLGKELTGSRTVGAVAALLLSLDFMHFTYARIATVDTYVVFFSLVSWIYFLKYLKTRNSKSTNHCDLVLWAVSSGLAFSTKWYSLFGLLGQLIILLTSRSHLLPETRLSLAEKQWGSKLKVLVHFTIISGAVYLATYLPQALQGYTLQDVVADQFQMLSFHTSLNATHPFSSPWYSWPMIIKPLWIFVSNLSANAVSTIVAMGNPAIWWLGFAATFLCIYRFYQHRDMISLFIPAIYLSQWLPYALLSRPLFIYHYYINVPILCLAIAVLLSKAWERKRLRPFILAYLLVAAGLFIAFYPVISGNSASRDLVDSLRWFSSWVF